MINKLTKTVKKTANSILLKMTTNAHIHEVVLNHTVINIGSKYKDSLIGRITLSEYSGCCGLCILTGADVDTSYRDLGVGSKLVQLAIKYAANELNKGCIQATTNGYSPQMEHILEKNGFNVIHEFVNPRTENPIKIWQLTLLK